MAEADALTMEEVEEICALHNGNQDEPDEEHGVDFDFDAPREITEEEWKRKCEREKAYAAEQNGRRNPFL